MKMLRFLIATFLVLGLTSVANAVNFQMVVVDPPPTYTFYDITSLDTAYTLSWGDCAPGEVAPGVPSEGCISLLNGSGTTITSLDLSVPDTDGVLGLTATCPSEPTDIFGALSCTADPVDGTFTFDFSGGTGAAPGQFFVIAEGGVDPSTFPDTTATASGVTPEPSSIWLLTTGVLAGGFFFAPLRRRALCQTRG